MTEDEDDDNHGGAIGGVDIFDHMAAHRESDDKPGVGCDRKSPPWLPDKTNLEVCHVNQVEQESTTNLTDEFAFITAEMCPQERIVNSSDNPLSLEPSNTGKNAQCPAKPFENISRSPETGFKACGKAPERCCTFQKKADDTSTKQEQHAPTGMSHCPPDSSSLVSGQSNVYTESGVNEDSTKEAVSQPFDDLLSPCRPPYCNLCPFLPVSSSDGYPTSSPVNGCKSKSSPTPASTPQPVPQMEFRANESRGNHRPPPSCLETVEQNHSTLLRTNAHTAHASSLPHAPVIRLCRLKDDRVPSFHANYTPRPISKNELTSGTPTSLLTFALHNFITLKEVKLFNMEYFRKRLPTLITSFIEFCGQGANGLVCFVNDQDTPNTCKTCNILENTLKPLNVLIRNPKCLVYDEEGPDVTDQDAILTVVSAGAGLVRLMPTCPTKWEQFAQFSVENEDEGNCFIKRFTQTVKSGEEAHLLSEIRQCLACLHWPTEIEKEFRERKRESNWLDQDALGKITKTECRVVPFLQQNLPLHDIDWLLIFPEAERQLTELLTNEQRKCFCIFQLVLQHRLLAIPQAEGNIVAISQLLMQLDHVLFHVCDTIKDHIWKTSPGYCFLILVKSLCQFLHDRHLPHYVVRNRNLLTKLSVKDYETLETACQETLESPLRVFKYLSENHKITNTWVLNELLLCNRLIGGHGANINIKRVLLPLALRLSKEFMWRHCPDKSYECIEGFLNEIATSETDRNNPCTKDVSGFFAEIPNSEKDVTFLCRLAVYLKLSRSIDISSFLPDIFTTLQQSIGPSCQLCQEIKDIPFPNFPDANVSEKVFLLEELAFQLTQHPRFSDTVVTLLKSTCGIAARAIDSLKAGDLRENEASLSGHNRVFAINAVVGSDEEVLAVTDEETKLLGTETSRSSNRDTPSSSTNTNSGLETHTYKVVRSLRESQFRCLYNLFRCYEENRCPEMFEAHIDELERLCEQLGNPKLYSLLSKILRQLGHNSRARRAEDMAQIRGNVRFGV